MLGLLVRWWGRREITSRSIRLARENGMRERATDYGRKRRLIACLFGHRRTEEGGTMLWHNEDGSWTGSRTEAQ